MSMKMTMAEFVGLEPCPFCGGEAEYGLTLAGEEVYCKKCHAAMPRISTEAEAIAAWNTRVERTCKVAASYDTADVDSRNSNAEWYFAFTCGCELYWDESEPPNYCPNCGSRIVDGKEGE